MTDRTVPCISVTTPECDSTTDQNEKKPLQHCSRRQVLVHLPVYYLPSCQPSAYSSISPNNAGMRARRGAIVDARAYPFSTCSDDFADQVSFPDDPSIQMSEENDDKDYHSETSSDDSSEELLLHSQIYSLADNKGQPRTSCSETEEEFSANDPPLIVTEVSDAVISMVRKPCSLESSYGLSRASIGPQSFTHKEKLSFGDTTAEKTLRKRQLEGKSVTEESLLHSRATSVGRSAQRPNTRVVRFSGSILASPPRPSSGLGVHVVRDPVPWKGESESSLLIPGLPATSPHLLPTLSPLPSCVRAVQDMVGGDLIYVNMIDSASQAMDRVETSKLRQVPYTPPDYDNTIQWYRDHQRARVTYQRASVLAGESLLRGEVEGDAEGWLRHLVQLAADRELWRHRCHHSATSQSRDAHPSQGGLLWLRSWARSLVLRCGDALKMVLYPPPCCVHPVTLPPSSKKSR